MISTQPSLLLSSVDPEKLLSFYSSLIDGRTSKGFTSEDFSITSSSTLKLNIFKPSRQKDAYSIPPPSVALCLNHERFSATEIHQRLRSQKPAIIGVIRRDNVHLDLRTVMKSQLNSLRESLQSLVSV